MSLRYACHLERSEAESKDPFLRKRKENGFLHSLRSVEMTKGNGFLRSLRSVEMTRVRRCAVLLLTTALLLALTGCPQSPPAETVTTPVETASVPPTTEAPTVAPETTAPTQVTETTAPPETRPANMTDLH